MGNERRQLTLAFRIIDSLLQTSVKKIFYLVGIFLGDFFFIVKMLAPVTIFVENKFAKNSSLL